MGAEVPECFDPVEHLFEDRVFLFQGTRDPQTPAGTTENTVGLLAQMLKDEHRVKWIVSWKTAVHDEAARTFAEKFYRTRAAQPEAFQNAYDRAVSQLELRDWVIDGDGGDPDPSQAEKLRARQRSENNPGLKAAGIPHLFVHVDDDDAPSAATAAARERSATLQGVGIGGMGEVRKVKDLQFNRVLAMKIIHQKLLSNREPIPSF